MWRQPVTIRPDLTMIICRVLEQATTSWSRTFRLALLLAAFAAGPAAMIILIAISR
jgi:hypothetical protein